MPKLKTNYIAQSTINIGRGKGAQTVTLNVPIDLTQFESPDDIAVAVQQAWNDVFEAAAPKVTNMKDLKAGLKAIAKADAAR